MGSTSLSSYSFYRPLFSSLVTSFSENSEKYQDRSSLTFNNNFFLSGQKYVKVKPGNLQVFGLENRNNVTGKKKIQQSKHISDIISNRYVVAKKEQKKVKNKKSGKVSDCKPQIGCSDKSSSTICVSAVTRHTSEKRNNTKYKCQEFCKLKRYIICTYMVSCKT